MFFNLVNVTNNGRGVRIVQEQQHLFHCPVVHRALFLFWRLLLRRRSPDALRDISLALLLAGIMGNLTDRLVHGHVIDFLLFNLHVPLANPGPPLTWPTPASASRSSALSFTRSRSPAAAAENPL